MDSGHVVTSALVPETISSRLSSNIDSTTDDDIED